MERKYISVHALNLYIKNKFINDISLQNVFIKGEISNYRPHPSGHVYFTLKDQTSKISAVMFASSAKNINFKIENGMQVLINARVNVYEASGQYQLYVQSMQQDGIGDLYLQYEFLKKKLENEGLFDIGHKKKIPSIPRKIAVLSAKQGAAVWDVVRTINSRAPFVNTVVFPVPVQGENAYMMIINTLIHVDQLGFDVIIIARGGGSLEDLMNFNNEQLARTIFNLKTPIISGIGHETDFTICDFVSDVRAVTPTGAALLATPDYREMKQYNKQLKQLLYNQMIKRLELENKTLERLSRFYFFSNPEQLYANELLRVSQLEESLFHKLERFTNEHKNKHNLLVNKLLVLNNNKISNMKHHLDLNVLKLDALSPLKILSRGYSIVYKDNKMIKNKNDIAVNDSIDIKMNDGVIKAKVKQVI